MKFLKNKSNEVKVTNNYSNFLVYIEESEGSKQIVKLGSNDAVYFLKQKIFENNQFYILKAPIVLENDYFWTNLEEIKKYLSNQTGAKGYLDIELEELSPIELSKVANIQNYNNDELKNIPSEILNETYTIICQNIISINTDLNKLKPIEHNLKSIRELNMKLYPAARKLESIFNVNTTIVTEKIVKNIVDNHREEIISRYEEPEFIIELIDKYHDSDITSKLVDVFIDSLPQTDKKYALKYVSKLEYIISKSKNDTYYHWRFNLVDRVISQLGIRSLPANCTGVKIDLSGATEQKVFVNYHYIKARRIGYVKSGSKALVVNGSFGATYYIGDGKALIKKVINSGGEYKKFGCTFTFSNNKIDTDLLKSFNIYKQLRIMAIMQPERLLQLKEFEAIKNDKILVELIEASKKSIKKRQQLADYLSVAITKVDVNTLNSFAVL